jgi:hypothetical protein
MGQAKRDRQEEETERTRCSGLLCALCTCAVALAELFFPVAVFCRRLQVPGGAVEEETERCAQVLAAHSLLGVPVRHNTTEAGSAAVPS